MLLHRHPVVDSEVSWRDPFATLEHRNNPWMQAIDDAGGPAKAMLHGKMLLTLLACLARVILERGEWRNRAAERDLDAQKRSEERASALEALQAERNALLLERQARRTAEEYLKRNEILVAAALAEPHYGVPSRNLKAALTAWNQGDTIATS